jgi:hypothetical protein
MASLLSRIRPTYFFGAFAIGLLMCYIITPSPNVVVKFPSPFNAGQVVYKDKANSCFKFNADKVSCPLDGKGLKSQPIMEDFRSSGRKLR